jgi:hypothetical protein
MLRPVFLENVKECGDVYAFDATWDKANTKKSKNLKNFDG